MALISCIYIDVCMYMSNNNASKETIKFLYRKHHTSTHHLYPNDHVCMHVYV